MKKIIAIITLACGFAAALEMNTQTCSDVLTLSLPKIDEMIKGNDEEKTIIYSHIKKRRSECNTWSSSEYQNDPAMKRLLNWAEMEGMSQDEFNELLSSYVIEDAQEQLNKHKGGK
jgi:hypothetical protein